MLHADESSRDFRDATVSRGRDVVQMENGHACIIAICSIVCAGDDRAIDIYIISMPRDFVGYSAQLREHEGLTSTIFPTEGLIIARGNSE
jgi:hypothetical protein